MTQTMRSSSVNYWGLAGLPLLILFWLNTYQYWPFIADDSLISLRYVDRFLNGQGLTWTAGDPVEGYSNLAWMLGSILLGSLGVDLIVSVRVLGISSMILMVWTLFIFTRSLHQFTKQDEDNRLPQWSAVLPWFIGASMIVYAPPIGVWGIGGLEANLYAGALLAYLVSGYLFFYSDQSQSSIKHTAPWWGALLCLTRPDGPLFIALWTFIYTGSQFIGSRRDHRPSSQLWSRLKAGLPMVIIPALATLGQLAFRLSYYGDWVPNTAHIKAEFTPRTLGWGLDYWWSCFTVIWPLSLPALLSWLSPYRTFVITCWLSALAWIAYISSVGGDIFPGHRHAVIVVALFALLTTLGLSAIKQTKRRGTLAIIALALTLLSGHLSHRSFDYRRAQKERWEWDGQIIGEWLGESFRSQDPLLAVTAAGTLPYFSKLRSLDMQGLNDRHIALQPAQPRYQLAHDHGDGDYVLKQRPDILAFKGVGRGKPAFVSGDQMRRKREFAIRYRLRSLEGQWPYWVLSQLFFRLDGAVGIHSADSDEIEVPPYLIDGGVGVPLAPRKTPDHLQKLGIQLTAPQQTSTPRGVGARWPYRQLLRLLNFPMKNGVWSVETDPPLPLQLKAFPSTGSKSADLAFYIRYAHQDLQGAPPKSFNARHEVLIKKLKFTRMGDADRVRFVFSTPTMSKEIGQTEVSTIILDHFEAQQIKDHPSSWHGAWQSEGKAFTRRSTGQEGKQRKVEGFGGKQFLNSFHPQHGDRETGKLWSPPFKTSTQSVLSFKLGGGSLQRRVGLRLWINGVVVSTWAGDDHEVLHQFHIDLSAYPDAVAQVEIFDESTRGWGHILVDDLWLSENMQAAIQYEETSKAHSEGR